MIETFLAALTLQAGYNAALVAVGAGLLGIAAGAAGTFLVLARRALVSDAVAHATLPGIGIAFMVMVALGGDGRALAGLLLGSAASAVLGLWLVEWIIHRTRLAEDAAIGAVLSVFFGFGIVLLTVIQTMSGGRQAGLEGFLLGSTAGMLFQDAVVIAVGGAAVLLLVLILRRPMTLAAFDPGYATSAGWNVRRIDLAVMALATAVTVIGLKLVGLILVVALLIIPGATAYLLTDRFSRMLLIAPAVAGVCAVVGIYASFYLDASPGGVVVLTMGSVFALVYLFSPRHGVLARRLARATRKPAARPARPEGTRA